MPDDVVVVDLHRLAGKAILRLLWVENARLQIVSAIDEGQVDAVEAALGSRLASILGALLT
jgi:hypothetical protein